MECRPLSEDQTAGSMLLDSLEALYDFLMYFVRWGGQQCVAVLVLAQPDPDSVTQGFLLDPVDIRRH